MKREKREKLEAAGWRVGNASEFLELSEAEDVLVELKLDLAHRVKVLRKKKRLSQAALAARLGSSQSRIAKLEAADGSVSADFHLKALVVLGVSKTQIGRSLSDVG